jgi:acetyl esterase
MVLDLAQVADVKNVPVRSREDRDIPGPGGPLPIRIYSPAVESAGTLPALIYVHGGAGVFCDLDTHEGLCRLLAGSSGCRVISVGYRLAPEHMFPAAVDDARAAARWTFEHSTEIGVDPKRTAIAGDSAGATLATVVCRLERDLGLALQLLLCPVTAVKVDTESRRLFSQGYFFDMATLDWALDHYLPAGADPSDPRLSPLHSSGLRDVPAAHIHTAEFDPFRDEGEAYADALARAGVSVHRCRHAGMIHHFYCMAGLIPQSRKIIEQAGEAIRKALAEPCNVRESSFPCSVADAGQVDDPGTI